MTTCEHCGERVLRTLTEDVELWVHDDGYPGTLRCKTGNHFATPATDVRKVVSMATRKVHRVTCRFVRNPGGMDYPFADAAAIDLLPACRVCR